MLYLLFRLTDEITSRLQLAGTSILVSHLSKVATHERTLMEQSRELLSTLATMHVSTEIHLHWVRAQCILYHF